MGMGWSEGRKEGEGRGTGREWERRGEGGGDRREAEERGGGAGKQSEISGISTDIAESKNIFEVRFACAM